MSGVEHVITSKSMASGAGRKVCSCGWVSGVEDDSCMYDADRVDAQAEADAHLASVNAPTELQLHRNLISTLVDSLEFLDKQMSDTDSPWGVNEVSRYVRTLLSSLASNDLKISTYSVRVPVQGYVEVEVDANTQAEALLRALPAVDTIAICDWQRVPSLPSSVQRFGVED